MLPERSVQISAILACNVRDPFHSHWPADVGTYGIMLATGLFAGFALLRAELFRRRIAANPIATDGVLSLNSSPSVAVGASSAKPGVGSVVVEPTGKYLYATNVSLGQIYAFSIDPSSGLLTAVHTSLTDSEVADPGPTPGELAVDISGKYLYCVNTPTPGGGTISIYSIDLSTGFLTPVGTVTNVQSAAGFALTGTMQ